MSVNKNLRKFKDDKIMVVVVGKIFSDNSEKWYYAIF